MVAQQLPFRFCEGTVNLLREVSRAGMKNRDRARHGEGVEGTALGQESCPSSSGPAWTLGIALLVVGPQCPSQTEHGGTRSSRSGTFVGKQEEEGW